MTTDATGTTETAAPALAAKAAHLEDILRSLEHVLIGYSGGVDSALLAAAAQRVLGDKAVAVTAVSPSLASGDLEAAAALCRDLGIRHEVLHTNEIDNPDYARNPTNRCYFCKLELVGAMEQLAARLGIPHVIYGQNADDGDDFRPGAQAARERGVRAPLAESGFTKAEIRALARAWGIPVWDRPAAACLSSRFPYGTPISAAALATVDRVERFLRQVCGYRQLRSRHHGAVARIELLDDDLTELLRRPERRQELVAEYAAAGYQRVALDLRGFRSGSMNEVLLTVTPTAAGNPPASSARSPAEVLAELAGAGALWTAHDHMLCIQLPESAVLRLAEPPVRRQLVQRIEGLGYRYVALDLQSLSG